MTHALPVLGTLDEVRTGKAVPYTRPGSMSAIDKQPVTSAVAVGELGLDGDEQGDRRVHGGSDKAVHCYTFAHYALWRAELPESAQALLQQPGAFGENFSVSGLDENTVCIGDRWRVGSALFEVSQGRQPCWKLNDRFGVPDMARRVQDSLRAGWYLRVLESGHVSAGDDILLDSRPHPDWPLARILAAIRDRTRDPTTLRPILELPLPPSWRKLFAGRLDSGEVEGWTARMDGPTTEGKA